MTDRNSKVTGVEFQRMRLGEPDEKERRRPEPMPGTEFVVECDTVLGAIGQGPELSWIEAEPEEIGPSWRSAAAAPWSARTTSSAPACPRSSRQAT